MWGQDFLCMDCSKRSKLKEGGNRLLYLWWTNMPDSMRPITLVLDTPDRALPDRPSTAGPGRSIGIVSPPKVSTFAGDGEMLRFRLRKQDAQRNWENLSAHGY